MTLPTAGCGGPSKSEGTAAQVSPEFQDKTSKMLKNMSNDMVEKFKKTGKSKR